MLRLCTSCSRHIRAAESHCPFCSVRVSKKRHVVGKAIAAGAAGIAAMTAGLGCAYGLPEDHADAGPDAGVQDAGADAADATPE